MSEWNLEEIVEVEELGEEETYDLEVDHPDHTFYANGISVSNSHAICYSILSYQCAWLFHYYPSEWACATLDFQSEDDKEASISLIKGYGFRLQDVDINKSGESWEISDEDPNVFVQPLSSIKGFGDTAMAEVMANRPFKTIEDLIFNDNIKYNKLNKKGLDVLCRSGALNCLIDGRFSGDKHFWSVVAVDRPKTKKKFLENIELYKPEGSFTTEERIEHIVALTGAYPLRLVMTDELVQKLNNKNVKPIGSYSELAKGEGLLGWCITRGKEAKKTKNGKDYWIVSVTDNTNRLTEIKVWGIMPNDVVHMNRPYLVSINKDTYGYSIRNLKSQVKLLA